jgi:hypothetical protein
VNGSSSVVAIAVKKSVLSVAVWRSRDVVFRLDGSFAQKSRKSASHSRRRNSDYTDVGAQAWIGPISLRAGRGFRGTEWAEKRRKPYPSIADSATFRPSLRKVGSSRTPRSCLRKSVSSPPHRCR